MVQLSKVRAGQIMEKDVLELTTLTPIDSAIELMQEYTISGAPVVDEAGELVGVLSATDIIKRDRAHNEEAEDDTAYYAADPFDTANSEYFSREEYSLDVLGRELTVDWMTPKVVSVTPDATLSEVCALMSGESIHRVFVVEGKRLQGVISTLDIVNYLAAEDSKEGKKAAAKRERKSTRSKTN
jgi:CBS domain-containing protein